jgi:GNAT superfamily N-acetyltransferase
MSQEPSLKIRPVTAKRWSDLEKLFGEHGAYSGCWCMYFRLRSAEFARRTGRENKRDLKKLVCANDVPGLLAYAGREPIGWVAIAPREKYLHLEHSRTLNRVDDQPVWSVTCFFVAKPYRRKAVMLALLRAAVEGAAKRGAQIVEAYPIEVGGKLTGYDGFTGVASVFRKAGFVPVKQISRGQSVMRYATKKWQAG